VIHLSVDPHFFPRSRYKVDAVKKKYQLPEEYLLYVGNIRPHKNIAGMIRGYGIALLNNSDIPPLVLCGAWQEGYDVFAELRTFSALEQEQIKQRVLFTSYLSYEDLPAVYTGATCLLFLSFYEGFGIPPLEAIACKTPVIASNTSSVPEVLEDNALFVSPYEPEAIADAIEKMLSDSSFRHTLIEQSGKILQKYDWRETAIQHLEIYQQFLEVSSSGKTIRHLPPSQEGIKKEKKPNKILFLEQYGNRVGGGQIILLDIVRYLKRSDQWEITVSLPEEGVFTQLLKSEDVRCVIHPVGNHSINEPMLLDLFRYSVSSLKSALRLSAFIKQEKIQLVYCNGGRAFLISILLGLFNPIKIIWHLHLIMVGRQKKMISWFGQFSKIFRIISVSIAAKQAFHGTYVWRKIQTIHNWISPELLKTSHPSSFSDTPSGIKNDRSVASTLTSLKCLVIGQISKEKGQLNLLRQIRQAEEIKIELDFAGEFDSDRKHEKEMRRVVSELNGEGHRVRLLGFQRNIFELLAGYRFLIIPSLAPESFGLTAIEAMSQGVIVIANKLGGLPEIMEHGREGLFYDAGEPISLRILLKEVMEGKYDLETIWKEALHKVMTKYHPDNQLKLIEGLITQAINEQE
ncbi:glycosyltransferase, partial [bacterium]|nr:glycosyltransferase [bacterium]